MHVRGVVGGRLFRAYNVVHVLYTYVLNVCCLYFVSASLQSTRSCRNENHAREFDRHGRNAAKYVCSVIYM